MLRILFLPVCLIVAAPFAGAQDTTTYVQKRFDDTRDLRNERVWEESLSLPPGEIRIFEDRRIARLDSLKRRTPSKIQGYRVQIFFGDRAEARRIRSEFVREYPHVPAYISYLAPNFRLRVGDFRSRLAAEKLKKELMPHYRSCYIVKDAIELPPLQTAETTEAGIE